MYKRGGSRTGAVIEYMVKDVAEILGYTMDGVARLIKVKCLRSKRYCSSYHYIPKKEFRRFMRENAKMGVTRYVNASVTRRSV